MQLIIRPHPGPVRERARIARSLLASAPVAIRRSIEPERPGVDPRRRSGSSRPAGRSDVARLGARKRQVELEAVVVAGRSAASLTAGERGMKDRPLDEANEAIDRLGTRRPKELDGD